jgi:chromosome segregation ATPase
MKEIEETNNRLKDAVIELEAYNYWTRIIQVTERNFIIEATQEKIFQTERRLNEIIEKGNEEFNRKLMKETDERVKANLALNSKINANQEEMEEELKKTREETAEKFKNMDEQFKKSMADQFQTLHDEIVKDRQELDKKIDQNKEIFDQFTKETQKNFGDIEENITAMEKRIKEAMGGLDSKYGSKIASMEMHQEVQQYLDGLYRKVREEQEATSEEIVAIRLQRLEMTAVDLYGRIEEANRFQEDFEQKTENNFRIAEQALMSHQSFLTSMDASTVFKSPVFAHADVIG